MSLSRFEQEIGALRVKIKADNTLLFKGDKASNDLQQTEKLLFSLSKRMLLAVAAKYGKDSSEYEMAGGVRQSEQQRRANRPAVAPAAIGQPPTV